MYVFRLFDKADPVNPVDARMLREGVLRIGRDPASDWVIVDPDCEISRLHCELEAGAGTLTLRALGTNGVFDEATDARLPDDRAVPIEVPQALTFGKYRLVAERAADMGLDGAADGRTMVLTPPLGESVEVPNDWLDGESVSRPLEEGSLLEAFCEGAGLDASVFSAVEPTELMRRAGAVYRQMVLGVGDLMAERDRARTQYRLALTTIGGANNNPFKWAPTQRLAIDLLMAGEASFLAGPGALKASFRDVKKHLVATFAGLQASLAAAVDTFAPASIERATAGRGSLLKSRAAANWDEVAARHADLVRQLERSEEGSLNRAFVDAYGNAAKGGEDI